MTSLRVAQQHFLPLRYSRLGGRSETTCGTRRIPSPRQRDPALERSLSVLLPVRNTQSTLCVLVEQILDVLPELTGSFELIIIDDGSTDATIEVADELTRRYPQVVVVRHGTPRGSAAAVQTGFQRSSGEVICVRDERGGLPLDQVPKMWRAMHKAAATQGATGRTLSGPLPARRRPALPGGFQMIHRKAIGPLGEIAAHLGDGEPSAACPSRPARPNFLRAARVS